MSTLGKKLIAGAREGLIPDYREIETSVSLSNIKDQVIAFLYATGMIHDDEDVVDLIFDWQFFGGPNIPITIKLKKRQQVEVLTY